MFTEPTGFALAPDHPGAPHQDMLPALIATLSLIISIGMVLTAVTISVERAAQLF
jgi:hypothetical protein